MDIKQLTYFITIVEEGTITHAANKLHMAQPPLSTQLKLLEDELGIKLIERGARKLWLQRSSWNF
jgi:LysR family transcriptional regulator, salicylic acid-responsive activator of bsdBCD